MKKLIVLFLFLICLVGTITASDWIPAQLGNCTYVASSNILDGTTTGQLTFWDASLGKWVHTETSELFWDDTNKRVGIGTDSPINKVEIVQAGGTASAFAGQIFSVRGLSPASYGYQLALSFSTTLDHRATVIGAGIYSQIRALAGRTVPKAAGIYIDTPVKEGGTGAFATAYGLYINTQDKATNNYGVYVKGSQDSYFEGNVGIGTDSPLNKVDVSGAMVIGSSYAGVETAPTDGLLVEGKVGINNTSPVTQLDVNGDVTIRGTLNVTTGFTGSCINTTFINGVATACND